MKKLTTYRPLSVILMAVLLVAGFQMLKEKPLDQPMFKAEVLLVEEQEGAYQKLQLKDELGKTFSVENDETYQISPRLFEKGDRVLVDTENLYIVDFNRSKTLFGLFMLFVITVLVVAGWQGIGALVGLGFSFLVLFYFVLPQILNGAAPVTTAIIGSVLIIPLTFYSSHGVNRKTSIAILSTILTLIVAGVLASIFADIAHITGLASEESSFLTLDTAASIDFQGLVLAGMLISILGILDDITISQASVVEQLKSVKESISISELFARAMRVGRDHISSMVNTLILVYTGASLPLILLFLDYNQPFSLVINYEFMSEEIVRTLVGSISLILAVPITTLLAAFMIGKVKPSPGMGSSTGNSSCCKR